MAISICTGEDKGHFDPATLYEDRFNRAWAGLIFDRLIELDGDNETYRPGLAEQWEVSSDGTVYRFT